MASLSPSSPPKTRRRVAIIGAGWAGLAAAVECVTRGHEVEVFEATRTAGGRARAMPDVSAKTDSLSLDNGQHILSGAYSETLRLMRKVGVRSNSLLRLPLTLEFADGNGLKARPLPSLFAGPLEIAAGLLLAKGWTPKEKWSLIQAGRGWRRNKFTCADTATVADLCSDLAPRIRDELIEPLCVAALNTPIQIASGRVFLRVLKDALFGAKGSSDLLLPRVDLGELFPVPAGYWLRNEGCAIRFGQRVDSISKNERGWNVAGSAPFDSVILATPAAEAAKIVARSALPPADSAAWCGLAESMKYEAITTVYGLSKTRLRAPMLALRASPDYPAQYVFDREQLTGAKRLIAFVVSASNGTREEIASRMPWQASEQLAMDDFEPVQTFVEKRATFACIAGMQRPPQKIAEGLYAAGDYVEGPYPATLEGAVRSGVQAAASTR